MDNSNDKLKIYSCSIPEKGSLPVAGMKIAAGFPSPADDFCEGELNLNSLLVKHPASTFFARVSGEGMRNEAIRNGDILVVDRAVEPYDGCIAVCHLDGEFTIKRIKTDGKKLWLLTTNTDFKPIEVNEASNFAVWGIVLYSISKH
ncbi:MAG: translesion error-prone DNA polymerase V autoproteolytic subunit [Bacteroidales bacterium]